MIKQYFADGMISIAIILSLLRTDIHQYLNSSLINYPEIHDIILGTSTAYTQTNFHNNYVNTVGGLSLHPKNIENEYLTSSILGELRSLSRFRRFHGLNTNINAFLVNPPTSIVPHATNAETENIPVNPSESSSSVEPSNSPNEDVNNNLSLSSTSAAQPNNTEVSLLDSSDNDDDFNGAFSLHPIHNVFSDPFSNSTVTASNLTNEDLDLIETLWRQDIDLGIGKEVFDLNLRKELEREREIELQKQREKQKELELLQYKLEEERRQQAQNWIAQNYVQDGETGEWIAVNSSAPDLNGNSTTQDQELSFEEAFRILDGVAPLSNETIAELDEYMGNVTSNVTNGYLQNVSSNQAQIDQLIETAQSFNASEINQGPGVEMHRQVSIEQHWQDLVSVLNLTSTVHTSPEPMDTEEISPLTSLPSEDNSVLLQNATMPQPILNASASLQPFSNTTFMPPADVYTNTSGPANDVTDPVVWNTGDMLFPNLTTSMNQSDALDTVDDILPDLLAGSELENITLNVDDMDLTDSLQCLQMADEVSSDSAVSSMASDSMASPVNDFNETSTLGSMSPFDGVEGATGGSEYASSGESKLGKYDPEDYNYSYSPYDTGDYNDQSNYSSSSNDTHDFQPPDINQVQHNHTYPLQPGSQPKESKTSSNKHRQKGPHSRDVKRAREMKLPITVDSIIEAPVDEFNEILSKYKLTEPQLQLIRDIRRRGKNKVAAQNCRKRKLDSIFTLEDELNNLKETKDRLLRERYMIDKETREMKGKFHHLYQEVFQSLRDEHGQPYDPNEFSLQETSDGNVFLVPRNGTANHPRKDFNRKRKDKR